MRCIVLVKASNDSENGVMRSTELLARMENRDEELLKAGIMPGGGGPRPTSHGKRTVIDAPITPANDQIANYWLWEVSSIDEAVEWLKRCPNPLNCGLI